MGQLFSCDNLCGGDPDPKSNPGPKGYAGPGAYNPQGGPDLSNAEEERAEAQRAIDAANKIAAQQGNLAHGTSQTVSPTGA